MSNKQPEALRLADNLETLRMNTATNDQAAAELRRLYAVNQQWEEKAATWLASPEAMARLGGYRDLAQQLSVALMQKEELREALENLMAGCVKKVKNWNFPQYDDAARVLIRQAERAEATKEQP